VSARPHHPDVLDAEGATVDAYTVEDLRRAEGEVIGGLPAGALMQRAAAGLAAVCARHLRQRRGRVSGRCVVLLVGAGNNGGDALWAGARLAARGAQVTSVLTAGSVHHEGLAALRAAGGRVIDARADGGPAAAATAIVRADLVVDGLVGLGGSPGLREPAAGLVTTVPDGVPLVAVDLPSGVDPDTGEAPAEHVRADITVTFGAAKPCLLLPPAGRHAGRVEVIDLGLRDHLPLTPAVERLTREGAGLLWPVPSWDVDKYRRGVLGVVAGSAAYPGAAVLSCTGAVRAGVGMVRYLGPSQAAALVHARLPEVVTATGQVQAWLIGPGLDLEDPNSDAAGARQREAVTEALDSGLPCVVDAGGLDLCARRAAQGRGLGEQVLLTPHAGELARVLGLLGESASRADVEARPLRHARLASERLGATVLLKGAITLVVDPAGRVRSQAEAPPWLATAGAGDVLAGVAGALLAAGLSALDAGSVAALVHGLAAAVAGRGGPVSASEVAEAVPAVVAWLPGVAARADPARPAASASPLEDWEA
jgi:hydroxyethylthiazole kinase-like uncharacterized protein yjeF